ncbi:MAG: cell division protein FtsL [Lachnospiraceae bacterium]|nr:cell division protein FtsL [Lachnospiraceae bacterium]
MAEKRGSYQTGEYIHGNTVRKLRPEQIPGEVRRRESRRTVDYTVRRNQEKALQMDLPFVVMLTIAAICTLYLCVNYLHVQSSITSRIHNIEKYEKELEILKSENDALETSINTYVDLDYVYDVATQELGMVYANKDQVILYNKTESEYVRQYEDIPKH